MSKSYYAKKLEDDGRELALLGLAWGVYERDQVGPRLIAVFKFETDAETFVAAQTELHAGCRRGQ